MQYTYWKRKIAVIIYPWIHTRAYKSLLRTGSMSRPKNIYTCTCINKKYFATNYVSCSINSCILVHITFNKTIAQVPIKWYTACPRLFYVHQAWLKMKNIFYNTSYIYIVLMWNEDVQFIINMCEHLDSIFLLRKIYSFTFNMI